MSTRDLDVASTQESSIQQSIGAFRAAAIQMSPVLFSRDGTVERVIHYIERCGTEGVRLAVFPETIVPNYPYFAMVNPPVMIQNLVDKLYEASVEVPGPVTEAVGDAAAKAGTVVVLGVNERDGGSLYNTQLIFDSDGTMLGKRRKIMPTLWERIVWGRGDGSGLRVFDTSIGRLGCLICWEHYMPLARYAIMAKGEQIHCSHFPGTIGGESMTNQMDAAIRHHAVESGAFVVNATAWLDEKQIAEISPDESLRGVFKGGHCTAIVSPRGKYLAPPLAGGEGMAVAEIDLKAITQQKSLLDSVGHYSRPDILQLKLDSTPRSVMAETCFWGEEQLVEKQEPASET